MIGNRLKELRTSRKLSQEELAKIVEVSPSAIQKWECDAADPNTNKLIKLADFFECSLDYLFGFNDDKKTAETFLLLEKIQKLDEDKRKEVNRFIDFLRGANNV